MNFAERAEGPPTSQPRAKRGTSAALGWESRGDLALKGLDKILVPLQGEWRFRAFPGRCRLAHPPNTPTPLRLLAGLACLCTFGALWVRLPQSAEHTL